MEREPEFVYLRTLHFSNEKISVPDGADEAKLAERIVCPRLAPVAELRPLPLLIGRLYPHVCKHIRHPDLDHRLSTNNVISRCPGEFFGQVKCSVLLCLVAAVTFGPLQDSVAPLLVIQERLGLVGAVHHAILSLLDLHPDHDAFVSKDVSPKEFAILDVEGVRSEKIAAPACKCPCVLPQVRIFGQHRKRPI